MTLNLSGSLEIDTFEILGYFIRNTILDKAVSFLKILKGTRYDELSIEFTISNLKVDFDI